jgi:hypothetical protein
VGEWEPSFFGDPLYTLVMFSCGRFMLSTVQRFESVLSTLVVNRLHSMRQQKDDSDKKTAATASSVAA